MAFFGSLKSLITSSPATVLNAAILRITSRAHSHSTLSSKPKIPPPPQQVKDKYDIDLNPKGGLQGWTDWGMKRDHRRRQIFIKHHCERKLVNTIRKNDILPREIREIAEKEVLMIPRDTSMGRLVRRCAISSRARGVVIRWRLSRHFFRHLADYNQLAGVQRGIW